MIIDAALWALPLSNCNMFSIFANVKQTMMIRSAPINSAFEVWIF